MFNGLPYLGKGTYSASKRMNHRMRSQTSPVPLVEVFLHQDCRLIGTIVNNLHLPAEVKEQEPRITVRRDEQLPPP